MFRPSPATPYQRKLLRAEEERFYAQDFGLLPPALRRIGAALRAAPPRIRRLIRALAHPTAHGTRRHPA